MEKAAATGPYEAPVFKIAGDRGLLVELGPGINPEVNARVRLLARRLQNEMNHGIREIIPTYRSVLIHYNPLAVSPETLAQKIKALADFGTGREIPLEKTIEIPVCYGEDLGPDISNVGASSGLSEREVIKIHSETSYQIYMVGFTPGFPFLGGLDPRLFTPRLETPRMKVPRGSVGIANDQTGIYPIASPGGWQIIGRTPLRLFAPERENPFLYQAGDRIRFMPISRQEYEQLEKKEHAR